MILDDIINNFDKINQHFKLELYENNKCFRGKCPLHNGDNPTSLSVFKTGHTVNGIWKCYTNNCHEKYGTTIIGFIRGLLSKKHNQDVEYAEAIKWIEKFFGGKYIVPESNLDTKLTQFFNKPKFDDTGSFKISVKEFLSRLEKPEYFIKRGYKPETLSHFKVGYCNNQSKRMFERVLVPQFDREGYVIGCLGRSIYEECSACKNFHNPKGICKRFPKWDNSVNFPSYHSLYNFYGAKKYIEESGVVLITESAPNVWRIREAGFPMSIGTFGTKFSEAQKELLDTVQCHTIIIVPDAGEPGQILVKQVHEQCQYTHNIITISPSYVDDVGACNVETTKNILGPFVDKVCGSF